MATFFGGERRGPGPRRFRALDPLRAAEGEGAGEGEEVLSGVVFDVDGTLWYVWLCLGGCVSF